MQRLPTANGVSRFFQSRQNALWCEWCFAQADADGIEDRVGDRCRDWGAGRLAAAESRHLGAIDQDDVDPGNVGESNHGISAPIEGVDTSGVEFDFFHKRAADALNNISLNQVF